MADSVYLHALAMHPPTAFTSNLALLDESIVYVPHRLTDFQRDLVERRLVNVLYDVQETNITAGLLGPAWFADRDAGDEGGEAGVDVTAPVVDAFPVDGDGDKDPDVSGEDVVEVEGELDDDHGSNDGAAIVKGM